MQQAIYGRAVDVIVGSDPRAPQFFSTPARESGRAPIFVQKVSIGGPYNLALCSLLLTLEDQLGNIALSKGATINMPTSLGTAYFPIDPGDTASLLGGYLMSVLLVDANYNPQLQYQLIPYGSIFTVTPSFGSPGQQITVGASQPQLALGPGALVLIKVAQNYTANYGDDVLATASGITITLPTAASAASYNGKVGVTNGSSGAITVALEGSDTIGGESGSIALEPRESLYVTSDGVSNFQVR